MILRIDGNISRYYVETLCMVFFPGSTFGENEEPTEGVPEVNVSTFTDKDNSETAFVSIKLNDRVCEASETVRADEEIHISTRAAIAVGRAIFAAGKELLGHTPPWGILTGVRPAKIAGTLLKSGNGIIKTKRILRDEYFLNQPKASLVVSVATAEAKIIKKAPQKSCSLYISIPFCPSRCSYCSFVSYTTPRLLSMIDEYLEAMLSELTYTFGIIKRLGLGIATIYIGGGTPTTLNPSQLERLLNLISQNVDTSTLLEFSLEAGRPDTITEEKLAVAHKYGVTRISVNPQTLNNEILADIGRKHTVKQFYEEVCWNEVDYMFVDMPPGTGDVPLTVFQSLPLDGIVVVTTPQDLVSMVVEKAVKMAGLLNVNVMALVENMSYFVDSETNKKHYIFGENGGLMAAKNLEAELIAQIPIAVPEHNLCLYDITEPVGKIFNDIVDYLKELSKFLNKGV